MPEFAMHPIAINLACVPALFQNSFVSFLGCPHGVILRSKSAAVINLDVEITFNIRLALMWGSASRARHTKENRAYIVLSMYASGKKGSYEN